MRRCMRGYGPARSGKAGLSHLWLVVAGNDLSHLPTGQLATDWWGDLLVGQ